jgi:hypothetical protein
LKQKWHCAQIHIQEGSKKITGSSSKIDVKTKEILSLDTQLGDRNQIEAKVKKRLEQKRS